MNRPALFRWIIAGPLLAFASAALALDSKAAAVQAGPPGKLVNLTSGMQMHYQERGSGEPLLLLHGFGGCGSALQRGAIELAKDYRVIIPDLRGHGWSTNPTKTFTLRQSAEDIAALMNQLGIQRVRAIGFSAGGMTLLHLAREHPQRIDAMVVVGATTHFPEQARRIMRAFSSEMLSEDKPHPYRRCAVRGHSQVRELVMQFNAFKDSYTDMSFTAKDLARIKARTMIVHGDRDAFFPASIAVALHEGIEDSELWVVPGAGHDPIAGRTIEFIRAWHEFLARKPRK